MIRLDEVKAKDQGEAPVHGDMLEAVLSHVPLTHLVGASYVCKSWKRAVWSSLHTLNPLKPWLIIHSQATFSPYHTSAHAYDPRSHVWMDISQPSINHVSFIKSSHSNFLYVVSPSNFSFSFDPLNLTWHHVDAPTVWRIDPVVAKVGDSIVVAGGTCEFEDDPLAVEVFSISSNSWRTCESMPHLLKWSASSTWISVAPTSKKLFLMNKSSGVMYSFHVETGRWSGPYDCRPDNRCFYSLIGICDDRLILVGLIGNVEEVEKVKIWEIGFENADFKEIAEMPLDLIGKLKSETFGFSGIQMCLARGVVYIYNSEMKEVVVCELINGGGCRWGSVRNPLGRGHDGIRRLVVTCREVNMEELQRAMRKETKFKEINLRVAG